MNLIKLLGITLFLLLLYGLLLMADPGARSLQNHYYLAERIGLYGIISLAAGILIISGGIDLSIGSVVGLTATILAILLVDFEYPWWFALPAVIAIGAIVGLFNGLLVALLRVQPFIVTLCGLFIFRGIARWLAGDNQKGLGTTNLELARFLSSDVFGVPIVFVIFLLLAAVATVFLHFSTHGRYIFAIGSNERAAKYSGISTPVYRLMAYVLCSALTAFFAIMYVMKYKSVQPSSTGSFFELYAIAGAVLGGCSLRGGEGTVAGIMVGTAILWILPNMTNMWGIPSTLEYTVIGGALLIGAVMDELVRIFRETVYKRSGVTAKPSDRNKSR